MIDPGMKGSSGPKGYSPLDGADERLKQYKKSRKRLLIIFRTILVVVVVVGLCLGWWLGSTLFN